MWSVHEVLLPKSLLLNILLFFHICFLQMNVSFHCKIVSHGPHRQSQGRYCFWVNKIKTFQTRQGINLSNRISIGQVPLLNPFPGIRLLPRLHGHSIHSRSDDRHLWISPHSSVTRRASGLASFSSFTTANHKFKNIDNNPELHQQIPPPDLQFSCKLNKGKKFRTRRGCVSEWVVAAPWPPSVSPPPS